MPAWPGGGSAPVHPGPGRHAEVTMAGKGRAFLGGALGGRKQQANIRITSAGWSTSQVIEGKKTIRYAMEWCARFNEESGTIHKDRAEPRIR